MKEILQELQKISRLLALQKEVITLEEFCEYAGISKSYVYHLTSTNMVKCYRPFGKRIYFCTTEVVDFLKQNQCDGNREITKKINNYFLKTNN
ncbi:MAG: helix-turn-helix domain-containing protein [Chitinophagales bacterium]|nr:helix-turn-helix domain-containing protein [Chitinophagales bacterium]